jgi:hypothetical protein
LWILTTKKGCRKSIFDAFHNSLIGELFKCVGQKRDPYLARLRDHCPFLVRESARRFFGHGESINGRRSPKKAKERNKLTLARV